MNTTEERESLKEERSRGRGVYVITYGSALSPHIEVPKSFHTCMIYIYVINISLLSVGCTYVHIVA